MTHEVLYLKAESREALIAALEAAGMGGMVDVFKTVEAEREVVSSRAVTPEEMDEYEDVPMDEGADSYTYQDGILTMYRTIAPMHRVKVGEEWQYKKRYQGDELYDQGTLYAPTGNMIQGPMGEVPEQAPIPGYHATLCLFGEVPDELEAIRVIPNNPQLRLGGWKSPAEIAAEEQMRMAL